MIMNQDESRLISYLMKKTEEYVILPAVMTVDAFAIYGNQYVKVLTFPDSVNEIGEKALAECGKLEYIYH
jgi:hypothetical protein